MMWSPVEVRLLHEDVDGGGVAAVPHTAALVVLAPLQQHHAVAAVIPGPGPGHQDITITHFITATSFVYTEVSPT